MLGLRSCLRRSTGRCALALDVRAELLVNALVLALAEQIKIEIGNLRVGQIGMVCQKAVISRA